MLHTKRNFFQKSLHTINELSLYIIRNELCICYGKNKKIQGDGSPDSSLADSIVFKLKTFCFVTVQG